MFACIDDDHGLENYSLLSRGVVKLKSAMREKLKSIEYEESLTSKFRFLNFFPKVLKDVYRILIRIKYTLF